MPTVEIYGSSDDLIEVDGAAKGCDEYAGEAGDFILIGTSGEQTRIGVRYNGCWAISVEPADEDVAMHEVAITTKEPGYSALATISGVQSVIKVASDT